MSDLIADIARQLDSGGVIPYLGSGMLSLCGDTAVPATPGALAAVMTAKVSVPHKIRAKLTQAAQFIENFKHRKSVVMIMDEAFAPVPTPSPLHRALAAADLRKLAHPAELELARKIAEWPRLVDIAARGQEPHRIAFYLYELASDLHAHWNRGNDVASLRFIQEGDIATSQAKIALARAAGVVISAGLAILGVTPAEEMR